ncbi:MAG: peptide chain release factor N(5)-glutamine methyltransferase [Ruminococcus sp.]|jgi:release factor glutamine methyltransferase
MSTLASMLKYGKEYLAEHKIDNSQGDAWYLMEFVWGIDRNCYFLHSDDIIEADKEKKYRELLRKRGSHVPLQYLTGECEFMGLSFQVNDRVLIPRQDTETLVETGLARLKPGDRVLDMCTGSGCIILSLEKLGPPVKTEGTDISREALEMAEKNRNNLGLKTRFYQSDLFEKVEGTFDMIVSNPPYIPSENIEGLMEEVRLFEPLQALDGGKDGLSFYRKIVSDSCRYLKPGGWLGFEIGWDQKEAVESILNVGGYIEIETVRDLAGLDRTVWGRRPQRKEEITHV